MAQGSSRLPVFDLAIQISVLIRNICPAKRCNLAIRQVAGSKYSTVPPLEPRVLLRGNEDSPLPAILRNGDCFRQRDALVRLILLTHNSM
jgi:hypothetical protein